VTRGRARIHLDATQPGNVLRKAACGWAGVDVENDISKVTCKSCLAFVASKRSAGSTPRRAGGQPVSSSDVQAELAAAFRATLAPCAPAPPAITPALWASSCKGGEHRRCGECDLCTWERDAQLWSAVSPWNRRHELARPEGAPRWSSLAAALVAFAEFERHDRCGPSAMGGILDRVQRGAMDAGGVARPDDPLLRRAGELVRVRQALERAYPEGAHALPAAKCRALLLLRTPGVVAGEKPGTAGTMPTYYALSVIMGVNEGELQRLVRAGRKTVGDDLVRRGLIPAPKVVRRGAVMSASHYAGAAE
jgi:hypothetical protein